MFIVVWLIRKIIIIYDNNITEIETRKIGFIFGSILEKTLFFKYFEKPH